MRKQGALLVVSLLCLTNAGLPTFGTPLSFSPSDRGAFIRRERQALESRRSLLEKGLLDYLPPLPTLQPQESEDTEVIREFGGKLANGDEM